MECEEEFFLGTFRGRGELLLGGFFRGGYTEAELTRLGGIESGRERLAEREHAGIFREHLAPGEDLHGVQQRAVGAEPGEEEAGDGQFLTHGWERGNGREPAGGASAILGR